ncbi:MAG: orotate phosphoribosyltransferase [Vampirovibrionales bacterium]
MMAQVTQWNKDAQALFDLLKTLSFKRGHFTLASGQQASFYMDCRLTLMDGMGSLLAGKVLYDKVSSLNPDAIGGVVLGAAPMVSSVLSQSAMAGEPLKGFLIRKEAKKHGAGNLIEGPIEPWMRVVLLEDVVTTGGSTLFGIRELRKKYPGIEIAGVIALVDRQAGAKEAFEAEGVPLHALYTIDAFLAE